MSKRKTVYVCAACGSVHAKWAGRCGACGEWNALSEAEARGGASPAGQALVSGEPTPITEGGHTPLTRLGSGLPECDRVLGGGIVPGSLTLFGGDPGIGKSTLMLQVGHQVAAAGGRVLYVSGEESQEQTRLRAHRLGTLHDNLLVYCETGLAPVASRLQAERYDLAVIDSIQSMCAEDLPAVPGSVGQVRECATEFLRLAKRTGTPVFLVGHVTKDGQLAGPRLLEHLVDAVLYFEGEGRQALRILRAVKNRFGSTNEIGVFEMRAGGLAEVASPSAWFLNERPEGAPGSVVLPSIEGTRPLLVEVQALVGDSHAGSPRRTVTGVNPNRVSLLLAVLEKRAGLFLSDRDVFVNVAGGVRLDEPAADLAVALAIVSSFRDAPLPHDLAAFGEVGLAGEVRAVDMAQQRTAEAATFSFARCLLPHGCAHDAAAAARAVGVQDVNQAIDMAFDC